MLSQNIIDDVNDWLEENGHEYDENAIFKMSLKELLNAYLQWNGIHGYTENIIAIIKSKI